MLPCNASTVATGAAGRRGRRSVQAALVNQSLAVGGFEGLGEAATGGRGLLRLSSDGFEGVGGVGGGSLPNTPGTPLSPPFSIPEV